MQLTGEALDQQIAEIYAQSTGRAAECRSCPAGLGRLYEQKDDIESAIAGINTPST